MASDGLSARTLAELRETLDVLDSADLVKHALLAEIDRLSRKNQRLLNLLAECEVTLTMWADVAPAVSLRASVRKELISAQAALEWKGHLEGTGGDEK